MAFNTGTRGISLDRAKFRDKVLGCWYGKAIGGTLGAPFETSRQMNDVKFYPPEINGNPLPNDDLDLQLVWLSAVERHGVRGINERVLGRYWDSHITGPWNEYGVCRNNIRMGIMPPLSGRINNDHWKWSNGAWIRSEIWACLFPASPHRAARLAYCDACCDHEGEGILAELFTAALESAAFVEHDLQKLLDVGLSFIPAECRVARAVRLARQCHADHLPFREARERIVDDSSDIGWFQAPGNLGFVVLGLLYGEGDFGRSVALAVNCGDDTDCTGGTVGAILGIINGRSGLPEKWCTPIGNAIKTCCIEQGGRSTLLNIPETLDELSDRVICCVELAAYEDPSLPALADHAAIPDDFQVVGDESLKEFRDLLKHKKSSEMAFDLPYGTIHFDFGDEQFIEEGKALTIKVHGYVNDDELALLSINPDFPEGWSGTQAIFSPFHSDAQITIVPGGRVDALTFLPIAVTRSNRLCPDIIVMPLLRKGAVVLNNSRWSEEENNFFWEERRRRRKLLDRAMGK